MVKFDAALQESREEDCMEPEVIMGVDPGFHVTGYAVLKHEAPKTYLLDYGYLQMNPKKHLSERVGLFWRFFDEKIKMLQVTQIALETSFLRPTRFRGARPARRILSGSQERPAVLLAAGRGRREIGSTDPMLEASGSSRRCFPFDNS